MAKVKPSAYVTLLQLLLVTVSADVGLKTAQQRNVLISPFLLAEGLMQLSFGAKGQTAEELRSAITYLNGHSKDDFLKYILEVRNIHRENKSSLFNFGSAVFVANEVNILPNYEHSIRAIFKTDVKKVNFGDSDTTVTKINNWVADQTNNAIQDIVQDTTSLTKIMLVSAIYFKGKWQHPFLTSRTRKMPFYVQNDGVTETIMCDFMSQTAEYNYAFIEELDSDAIALPYADSDISMVIIKPREPNGIEGLMAGLNSIHIHSIFEEHSVMLLNLHLPKFKFEYNVDLKPVLQSFGVHELFQSANLTGMTDYKPNLSVSEVVQKGFIAVDEEGTTASAAQAIKIIAKMRLPEFSVNHPFVFYIVDRTRIYFNGMIFSPI